ncbi:cell division protein FtsQ [Bartonella australis AUST/NH1]|uniref:Cell division protein FtsQ n=1 Tax=Bartonella australis (strain Aust/NH1) TaxID=1094489 RepID=M1NZ38_BARAA|nr:cell division protein FtsQ [Bartonella australis AUST/NH1]
MHALNVSKMSVSVVLSAPVLPRLYRRCLRFIPQFMFRDRYAFRCFGSFAVLFFFFLSGLYGLLSSGRVGSIMKDAASSVGFMVANIEVNGGKRLAEKDILKILGLDARSSIINFDVDEARSVLEQQAWIQSADVQKIYPNRVRISVVEREPYAIWQHDGVMDIIDGTGRVIVPFQAGLVQNLPLVVGQGAQDAAKLFIQSLSVCPQFRDHIRSYVRVGDRRWDVILDNGMRIMLPEKGAVERLIFLTKTGVLEDLFSRDILSIDLRLSDRITVALSDEMLERYHEAVRGEERALKALKAGGV